MKVMTIGDTHLPFHHKNYLKFLCDFRDEYKPDVVVHIGDFVDNHALSNYMKDPDGFSASDEWKATVKATADFYKEFPEVHWIVGNHDRRPYRKAYDVGMSPSMVKPLNEIYDCPTGWKIHTELILDDVLYTHGEGAGDNLDGRMLVLNKDVQSYLDTFMELAESGFGRTKSKSRSFH